MGSTCHRRSRLSRLPLGLLEEVEARQLREHAESCELCAPELRRVEDLYHRLGEAAALAHPVHAGAQGAQGAPTSASLAGPPGLRSRLLATAGRELRLSHLVPLVAHHLELDDSQAREVLARIDDPSTWGRGPGPGISMQRLTVGARCQSTLTTLIRLEGGAHFPEHGHLGDEVVVVLQGQMREAGGRVHRSGAEVLSGVSTEHGFDAAPGPDLVCLVIVEGGVRFGDRVFRA